MSFELDHAFSSFEDWRLWSSENDVWRDTRHTTVLASQIVSQGFIEPLTQRRVTPSDIVPSAPGNWREGLIAFGKNSRTRAVLRLIEEKIEARPPSLVNVYATEAVTSFALCLRGLFPRFLGSEYATSIEGREELYPIPHEDLMHLSLKSGAFDIVSTNEVLEHIPSIDAALAEIARVLKPGGWHVGTHPFAFMNESGIVRTQIVGGQISHLLEPEYHGNPAGPPSLVFETPGWDILNRARAAGFAFAQMRFVASERYGYLTENLGVFVLCCQK